jgi:hypothetical protein
MSPSSSGVIFLFAFGSSSSANFFSYFSQPIERRVSAGHPTLKQRVGREQTLFGRHCCVLDCLLWEKIGLLAE